VREASRVPPLEASRRVTQSEGESVRVRFGLLQFLALAIGGAKFAGWIADRSMTNFSGEPWVADLDRALDFVSFPLFIYGLVTLIASRQRLMSALIAPMTWLMAGPLRHASLRPPGGRGPPPAAVPLPLPLPPPTPPSPPPLF